MRARTIIRRASCSTVGAAAALLFVLVPTGAAPAPVASTSISGNWAGYVVSPGSGVTEVDGSWTVPNAGSLVPGLSATWIGIGGYSTTDLIQTGTEQNSFPLDAAFGSYSAWYELLPASPVPIGGPVSPGDHITASIVSNGGDNWTIDIADSTQRWSWSSSQLPQPLTYTSNEASAEWIHESPSLGGVVPVPVGGPSIASFDGGHATIGRGYQTVAGSGAFSTVALPVETTVSGLDPDGDGFNVCTYAVSCAAPGSS